MQRFLILFLLTTACLGAQGQQLAPNDYIYPLRELKQRLYSANFGEIRPGHFHAGVDIKTDAEEGKPVVAAADGYVSRVVLQAGTGAPSTSRSATARRSSTATSGVSATTSSGTCAGSVTNAVRTA